MDGTLNGTRIVAAGRTPVGAFQGALAPLAAPDMTAALVKELAARLGAQGSDVDHALLGNVLSAGLGQAPARQVTVKAGLGDGIPAVTLNKMCGSGLEAVIQADRMIRAGDAGLVLAGGMESMSNAPFLLPGARAGLRLGDGKVVDSLVHDGLWDVYNQKHMGSCAELAVERYGFTREDQDEFAITSYRRAQAAAASGASASEIVAVEVPGRRGQVTVVGEDEGPAQVDFDRLPQLRPAFEKDGTITAANASTLNDGAAALFLAAPQLAEERGWDTLGTVVGSAVHAHAPEWFTTAPVTAMRRLLDRLGWQPGDVDLYEINEAFSVVTMAAMKELELPADRVNVRGGAVALGHPIGASGARILVTLLSALRERGGGRGMAAICIGGGEALALAVEV